MLEIKVVNTSSHILPAYETSMAAGMDLRANISQEIILVPQQRQLISTGLFIELPMQYEAQIRPRSGLAFKYGVTVLNAPGTIDADYRGEIKVLLINHGNEPFVIQNGDRIAQMIIAKHEVVEWTMVQELNDTQRGTQGYGHTGV